MLYWKEIDIKLIENRRKSNTPELDMCQNFGESKK